MSKFSKKFCGKSPVKQYKEEVVIDDSNAAENLSKAEYSRISDGSIKPAIPKEHIDLTLKEHDEKIKEDRFFDKLTSAEERRWKNEGGMEMTSNPIEWFIGPGAVKPAFNLFKNWGQKTMNQVSRYARKQLPKAGGEASFEVGQQYIKK